MDDFFGIDSVVFVFAAVDEMQVPVDDGDYLYPFVEQQNKIVGRIGVKPMPQVQGQMQTNGQ
jgi:hypothetical protein